MSKQYKRLQLVVGMLKDRELSKLSELAQQKRETSAKIARIRAENDAAAKMSGAENREPLFLARDAFDRWSKNEIVLLNRELFEISGHFEEQMLRARNAVGRDSAFEKLFG